MTGDGDPSGLQAGESATFCRDGDQYRVNLVYCPEARDSNNAPIHGMREIAPAMDAAPADWYVRLVFDELLDPEVERLITDADGTTGHINQTQPVTLRCGGVELAYDGYYEPSGNHLSYPPGPSLVVDPDEFIASGTDDCEIVVDTVSDKDGEAVPSGQIGPYRFGIAPLRVYGSTPEDDSTGVALDTSIQVDFGAPIDLASTADTIVVSDTAGNEIDAEPAYLTDDDGEVIDNTIVVLDPMVDLAPGTSYTIEVRDGIMDTAGGPLVQDAPFTATFDTGEAE